MIRGRIIKVLSGFYTVQTEEGALVCKARGRFRLDGTSPLVGDLVLCSTEEDGQGRIDSIEPRRNRFVRPAVANIDTLIFVASGVNPVTDPFLIDRVSVIAAEAGCELLLCINKADLDPADTLYELYSKAGFRVLRTSALTGEGLSELREEIDGRLCAFTGNSGVGKSSLLNRLIPEADAKTAEVSEKLGRGKHTTRHVELFSLGEGTCIADTPGFASFDLDMMPVIAKDALAEDFIEFRPFLGRCSFRDCAHLAEPGCAVTQAVEAGKISASRYHSYTRLYEICDRPLYETRR